jgi:hypothetical protein
LLIRRSIFYRNFVQKPAPGQFVPIEINPNLLLWLNAAAGAMAARSELRMAGIERDCWNPLPFNAVKTNGAAKRFGQTSRTRP